MELHLKVHFFDYLSVVDEFNPGRIERENLDVKTCG